jgi:hypothetical protein
MHLGVRRCNGSKKKEKLYAKGAGGRPALFLLVGEVCSG